LEFEREHAYFNSFKLIRAIHNKDLNLGIVNGKVIAFKDLFLPSSIKNEKGKNWTKKLSSRDDKTVFKGKEGDVLTINFNNIQELKNPHLIFRASLRANYSRVDKSSRELEKASSGRELLLSLSKIAAASLAAVKILEPGKALAEYPCKSVNISLLYEGTNKEKLIEIVHPRERLSLGMVDISIKKGQKSLSLKMEWTKPHDISFIGLADVAISKIKQDVIDLSSLKHSEDKKITKKDLKSGKVELIPGQYVELEFPASKEKISSDEKASFFLNSKGYYVSI